MLEKKIEERNSPENQTVPAQANQLDSRMSTLAIALCAFAFVMCILLTVAPLSRIPDPVLQLQTPLGAILAQAGAWLPIDLGLTANHQASLASTNYVEFLALIALAFVIYGLCALFIRQPATMSEDHKHYRRISRLIWSGTIAAGLIYVFTPAMLSHDIIVYASSSRLMAAYHANPYFVPISAYPHDPFTTLNYWANSTSPYGPVWTVICSLWGFILEPQAVSYVLAFRLFALAAHLVNTWLVATTLRTSGQSNRIVTLGTLLYAWNPLVLLESSLGGHNDVFMVTFLLLGILLSIRAEKAGYLTDARGYLPPVIAFTLAALVKFTTLPLITLFILFLVWRALRPHPSTAFHFKEAIAKGWRPALLLACTASITSALVALAFYGPFWIGHGIQSIQRSFASPPSALYAENSILRAILAWNQSHTLPPHTLGYTLIQVFSVRKTWDSINIAILAGAVIAGAIWLWHAPSTRTFALVSLATLGALLIVTPWFYSWYVTWLVGLVAVCLPLAQNRTGRSLLAFTLTYSATAFLTYLFKDGYPPFGIWIGPVCLITIMPPLLAFLISYLTWRPPKEASQHVNKMASDT
jgi:hypothetical protein